MNVCNVLVPGSGSVPGCSRVPDAPGLPQPAGRCWLSPGAVPVLTSPGFCQASIPAPLTAGFDALGLVHGLSLWAFPR